ncbi:MAG: bifunctional phosphopantothenoylcysteine decarboxylase/phosphopantothenate--cysteine ligase CoaBC [Paludibacteraceae bacterium]|nr:bifunctional phosphopantothenoylcysteine decarboxylase/phosphopantothenate--cysteine ligase CoaBC [Paludibacteraceae bacterium]
MTLSNKHILVGISGGIAAYKIPELIRSLTKAGAEVRVATTKNALEFVTELTLQTVSGSRVYSDVFAAINEHATEHISLPDWCDAMIVAPATANVLSKSAAGIADDALTTTICSCVARKPIIFAPAMNDKMWENPATQQAIATLRSWEQVRVLEPDCGALACGVNGKGRMPEIEVLQEAVTYALTPQTMPGRHVLITAGGTQEKIDPVRFISNYSTGKMGMALAHACARRGAEVTLVCGAVTAPLLNPFGHIRRIDAISAQAMYEACMEVWPKSDTAILCAAVADFTPASPASEKIKKEAISDPYSAFSIQLKETKDIAKALGESKQVGQKLIGFALETEHEKENALRKMERKHLDAIVLNSLRDQGAGFGTDTNVVTLMRADGKTTELPLLSKSVVAETIVETLI